MILRSVWLLYQDLFFLKYMIGLNSAWYRIIKQQIHNIKALVPSPNFNNMYLLIFTVQVYKQPVLGLPFPLLFTFIYNIAGPTWSPAVENKEFTCKLSILLSHAAESMTFPSIDIIPTSFTAHSCLCWYEFCLDTVSFAIKCR